MYSKNTNREPVKTLSRLPGTEDRYTRPRYRRLFDAVIGEIFQQALRIIHSSPPLLLAGAKIAWYQKKAGVTRQEFERQGLFVRSPRH